MGFAGEPPLNEICTVAFHAPTFVSRLGWMECHSCGACLSYERLAGSPGLNPDATIFLGGPKSAERRADECMQRVDEFGLPIALPGAERDQARPILSYEILGRAWRAESTWRRISRVSPAVRSEIRDESKRMEGRRGGA